MRRATGVVVAVGLLLVLLFFTGTTRGAMAVFTPASVSASSAPGSTAMFFIGIESELPGGFNVADVVIGSNDLPADRGRLSFAYSDEWSQKFANVSTISTSVGMYTQEVYVGGNNPDAVGDYCMLGTLTIDTGGLGDGDYEIRIDSDVDGISGVGFNDNIKPLRGAATLHIPEPAALLVLILGGFLYRRSGR